MKRLTTQLQTLAEADALRTDPNAEQIEGGWARLSAAVAAPEFAAVASTTAATGTSTKILGFIAVLAIGVGGAVAVSGPSEEPPALVEEPPAVVAVESEPAVVPAVVETRDEPQPTPTATEPPQVQPVESVTATPVVSNSVAKPKPKRVMSLAEQVRALGAARRQLDTGNDRKALRSARMLLRQPDLQVGPEAQAVEAIAACGLGLSAGPALVKAFVTKHPASPLRGRVERTCAAR